VTQNPAPTHTARHGNLHDNRLYNRIVKFVSRRLSLLAGKSKLRAGQKRIIGLAELARLTTVKLPGAILLKTTFLSVALSCLFSQSVFSTGAVGAVGSGGAGGAVAEAKSGAGSAPKYQKYTRRSKKTKLIPLAKFVAVRDSISIRLFSEDSGVVISELESSTESLLDDGSGFSVTPDGFVVLGRDVLFSSIYRATDSVYKDPEQASGKIVVVTFWTTAATTESTTASKTKPTTQSGKRRSAARLASRVLNEQKLYIPQGDFIRGSVVNFDGDVVVEGEVNHSVIVFGGNVAVGENGVVRDHVVAFGGHVTVASGSKVYGYILPNVSGHRVRRPERPWTAEKQRLSFVPSFTYNRVDGFAPRIGWKFTDVDSTLPELKLTYGLALTSERQRYRFGARQPLFGASGFSVNGAFYQELKSDDDHLLPEWQNTLYSLLTTTDYKNYYEAEGGSFGVSYDHLHRFTFALDFYTDKARTIRSTRELWSLFGGDKKFYPNYQGIPSALADSARVEFDDKRTAGLIFSLTAHSKKFFAVRKTQWRSRLTVERALGGFNSDFSFTRYALVGQYQTYLTKYTTLIARGRLRTSDGDLPLYRKFFNGGYHWLRGFNHKEFIGTKDWTLALDYGVNFNGVGIDFLRFWMFYDVGQIADHTSFSDTQLLQSLGVGLAVGDFIRLNFARRLDQSDPSWRIAVEL